ncbi:MAG: hypothetical protein QF541_18010 [Lentisphaeria bacterium]|jgi:hypothetical protein|nr:hypothetical protein [Lentisphaeria bacterium]
MARGGGLREYLRPQCGLRRDRSALKARTVGTVELDAAWEGLMVVWEAIIDWLQS